MLLFVFHFISFISIHCKCVNIFDSFVKTSSKQQKSIVYLLFDSCSKSFAFGFLINNFFFLLRFLFLSALYTEYWETLNIEHWTHFIWTHLPVVFPPYQINHCVLYAVQYSKEFSIFIFVLPSFSTDLCEWTTWLSMSEWVCTRELRVFYQIWSKQNQKHNNNNNNNKNCIFIWW